MGNIRVKKTENIELLGYLKKPTKIESIGNGIKITILKRKKFDLPLFMMVMACLMGGLLMALAVGCLGYMLFTHKPALYVVLGFLSVTTIVYLIVRKYQDD